MQLRVYPEGIAILAASRCAASSISIRQKNDLVSLGISYIHNSGRIFCATAIREGARVWRPPGSTCWLSATIGRL